VLYFRNPSYLVDELEAAGVPALRVPKRRRLDPGFVWKLATTLRSEQFDVVHCFSLTGELWGAIARRMAPGPALVTSVRGYEDWPTLLPRLLKRWITAESRTVVANSVAGARYTEDSLGLVRGAVRVVYNGVEPGEEPSPEARTAARRELGIAECVTAGLFAGRLVPVKGLPSLLRAAARLGEERGRFVLLIAGDGPERGELESLASGLGIGGMVRMLGSRSDVPRLMQAADLVVLPSEREGLSNAILEGMAAGRAVVASRTGGNSELVEDGVTGLLHSVGNDAEIARALSALVRDGKARRALGEAGRRRVLREFGMGTMVEAMGRIYQDAVRPAVSSP
jgi:glycosyltransferase involved in cell wall biosynthesis